MNVTVKCKKHQNAFHEPEDIKCHAMVNFISSCVLCKEEPAEVRVIKGLSFHADCSHEKGPGLIFFESTACDEYLQYETEIPYLEFTKIIVKVEKGSQNWRIYMYFSSWSEINKQWQPGNRSDLPLPSNTESIRRDIDLFLNFVPELKVKELSNKLLDAITAINLEMVNRGLASIIEPN